MHTWFDAQLDQKILDGIYFTVLRVYLGKFFFVKIQRAVIKLSHLTIFSPDIIIILNLLAAFLKETK